MGRVLRRTALGIVAGAFLWACGPEGSDSGPAPAERVKIVVEFAGGGEPALGPGGAGVSVGSWREVAERILSRLEPEVRESARVFERLPFMALEADAATLVKLMRMPEVACIAPDREVGIRAAPGAEAGAP